MASHDSFLDELLQAFPEPGPPRGAVRRRRTRNLTETILRVFLPDFHWMSRTCLQRYTGGYQFTGNRLLKNGAAMFSRPAGDPGKLPGCERGHWRFINSATGSICGER